MSGVGRGGVGDKCSRWLPEGIILCFSYHLSCANIILCISWIQLFSVCTKLDHFLVEVTRGSNMTTQWVILTKHWSVRVKWVNALEGVGPLSAFQQLIICSLLTLYDLDPSFLHFYDFQNKIYHKNLINPPPQHNIFFLFWGGGAWIAFVAQSIKMEIYLFLTGIITWWMKMKLFGVANEMTYRSTVAWASCDDVSL